MNYFPLTTKIRRPNNLRGIGGIFRLAAIVLVGGICVGWFLGPMGATLYHPGCVAILSSLTIPPYQRLTQAIKSGCGANRATIFFLDQDSGAPEKIAALKPGTVVTVGRSALEHALPLRNRVPIIFTMVLFPGKVLRGNRSGVRGIGMIPSPKAELRILHEGFGIKRLALFYNPGVTGFLVKELERVIPKGMSLNAVPVASAMDLQKELPEALQGAQALLLTPDPTILTEQGFKQLLAACYEENVAMVGFSPMYIGMGAAITISVSEKEIAGEAVTMVRNSAGLPAEHLNAVYYLKRCDIRMNRRSLNKLGLTVNPKALSSFGTLSWKDRP